MAIVAGIDEAGLGPVLGPLVMCASAFWVPDELADVSLWRLLAGGVSRTPGRRKGGVAIGDSKKLYSRRNKAGLAHLERGVLAMLAVRGGLPTSLRKLLDALAPAAGAQLADYPWYADADVALPHSLGEMDVRLSSHAVATAMDAAGVRLERVRVEPVFTGQFNRMVAATNNKSTLALSITGRLLRQLWDSLPGGPLRICVDRQGGRMRYLSMLEMVFDGCALKVLEESETLSAYRITRGDRQAEVCFRVGGERASLPVAFSSMLSKYLRELFMGRFNAFWTGHAPGVAPTAGYYTDGRRFYQEIRDARRRLSVDDRMIYRSR